MLGNKSRHFCRRRGENGPDGYPHAATGPRIALQAGTPPIDRRTASTGARVAAFAATCALRDADGGDSRPACGEDAGTCREHQVEPGETARRHDAGLRRRGGYGIQAGYIARELEGAAGRACRRCLPRTHSPTLRAVPSGALPHECPGLVERMLCCWPTRMCRDAQAIANIRAHVV